MTSTNKSLKSMEQAINELVEKAQSGDTEAFSQLYDIFFTPLYRYVYYRVSKDEYEDILEMVFMKMWTNLKKYKKTKSTFSSWVFRIAHNLVVDHYRSAGGTVELSPAIEDQSKESQAPGMAERRLNNAILKQSLMRLKEDYQQILVLKFLDELKNDEIAMILGRSQNSLRILQFRALRALRKEMEIIGIYHFE